MGEPWSPDLNNIAHALEDLESDQPKPLALKTLRWLVEHSEAAQAMWAELTAARAEGVTLFEVAKLVVAAESGGASPESQPVVVWLLEQIPSMQEHWQTLRQLCEDMAVDPHEPRRPLSALQRSRDLDRLLALDFWSDPAELLDPRGVYGYLYEELLALLEARIHRAESGPQRDQLLTARIRIARYAEMDRKLKNLDEKFRQLQRWRENEGQGLTAEQLEDAAALLRMAERGTAA